MSNDLVECAVFSTTILLLNNDADFLSQIYSASLQLLPIVALLHSIIISLHCLDGG